MKKGFILFFLATITILLSGYGCSRDTKPFILPRQQSTNQTNSTKESQCQITKEEIKKDLMAINYCQTDDECVYVGEIYCPFGCYFLHNKKENFAPLRIKMLKYNTLCGECRAKCPPAKAKQSKCIGGKCVLKEFLSPQEAIKSMLPSSWKVTTKQNTRPAKWEGDPTCLHIKAENSNELYQDPQGHFSYSAFHDFWFCPSGWNGRQSQANPVAQKYPATFLCNCQSYKIFHFSLGENSQKDLPKKIKDYYQ